MVGDSNTVAPNVELPLAVAQDPAQNSTSVDTYPHVNINSRVISDFSETVLQLAHCSHTATAKHSILDTF